MHSEVLWSGDGLKIFRIIALQAFNEGNAQARSQIGILAVGFLAAAPARIAKNIDVRRPDGEAAVPVR